MGSREGLGGVRGRRGELGERRKLWGEARGKMDPTAKRTVEGEKDVMRREGTEGVRGATVGSRHGERTRSGV